MAYRSTLQTRQRQDEARRTILATALARVAAGGWAAAQVTQVAEAAGVAVGTIYRHWPSKAELCAEIVAAQSEGEVSRVRAIADEAAAAAPARLAAAVGVFARRALRGRRLAFAVIAEPVDPGVEEVRLFWRAELARQFARIIEAGVASDLFAPQDPAIAAAGIVGAFMEALVGPLAPANGPQDDERLVAAMTAFCLRAVGARQEDD